jgi:transposase
LSTKIHAVVDERGLPVRLLLTAGQASDKATAPALIDGLPTARALVADRGYNWKVLIDLINSRGGNAQIPTQSNVRVRRSVDPGLYRQRNLIERFFNKIKHFRRVATRFDKLARNYLAAVMLASTRLWIKAYESTT